METDAWEGCGYLDVNDRHPELFGDAILLRDDDSMGFALSLDKFIGKHVKITITEVPSHDVRLWKTDAESALAKPQH